MDLQGGSALLIGIIVGTYSSVFPAAPLAVAFQARSEPAVMPTGEEALTP